MKLTKSQQKVETLRAEAKRLWALKCEHDGIDPNSKFVVFSTDGYLNQEYNDVVTRLQAAVKAEKRNAARRARHEAYRSCGMTRVCVNGKVFYE